MTINTDLLIEIREQITAHPETHDQLSWGRKSDCGTTYCIAGWAAVLTDASFIWSHDDDEDDKIATLIDDHEAPDQYAARVMGLEYDDAARLFYTLENEAALSRLDALIEKGKNGS
ncbi:hypothetical protein [Streptomyces sp. NPDC046925]|uniref:hypothetical protein n=1 Tax=Streptomyces sp. NPDC046925 TaxID=3155375 RepID=UPI003411B7DA